MSRLSLMEILVGLLSFRIKRQLKWIAAVADYAGCHRAIVVAGSSADRENERQQSR